MKTKICLVFLSAICFVSSSALSGEVSKHQMILDSVHYGIKVIETKGKAGLEELKTFRFAEGEGYLIVTDWNGIMIFNGAFPQMAGKDMSQIQDTRGKFFFAEMKSKYQKYGSGWTSYWWPNPKTQKPEMKCTYFKKTTLEGKPVIVMAGLYNISEDECK